MGFTERDTIINSAGSEQFWGALAALRDPGADLSGKMILLTLLLSKLPVAFTIFDCELGEGQDPVRVERDKTTIELLLHRGNEQLAFTLVTSGSDAALSLRRGPKGPLEKMLGPTLVVTADKGYPEKVEYSDSRGLLEVAANGRVIRATFAFGPHLGGSADTEGMFHGLSDLSKPFEADNFFRSEVVGR